MDDKLKTLLSDAFSELDAFSIPGIGTFQNGMIPAIVDSEANEILPPAFGWMLKEGQDAMPGTEEFIASALSVSTDKAGDIARQLGREVMISLEKGEVVSLGRAGNLSSTKEGDFVFEADDDDVDEFFGLMPVTNPFGANLRQPAPKVETKVIAAPVADPPAKEIGKPVGKQQESKDEVNKPEPELAVVPSTKEEQKKPKEKEAKKKEQPKKEKKRKKKKEKRVPPIVYVAAIMLILGSIGGAVEFYGHEMAAWLRTKGIDAGWLDELAMGPTPEIKENTAILGDSSNTETDSTNKGEAIVSVHNDVEKSSDEVKEETSSNKTADKEKPALKSKKKPVKETTPVKKEKPAPVMDASGIGEMAERGTFYLVAKTFPDGSAAEAWANSQSKPGYNIQVLKIRSNRYYVTVYASTDKMEVISNMVDWKNDFKPNSWIYTP